MTKLHLGDCLHSLKKLEPNSIDSVVTDPPYGLKFMGKKWDYSVPSIEIWREVLRVLKPGGHVLSFCGTRTYHRMVVNMEDAGFEIRDQIQWIYGSGFPKSHNGDHGGTALKPANEPICLARKPLEGTVAKNFEKWGVGGLNIDASRIGTEQRTYSINGAIKGGNFGNKASQPASERDFVSAQGRWPANVLFDEEAASVLDEQVGHLHGAGNKKTGQANDGSKSVFGIGGRKGPTKLYDNGGGASRFFYVAKASKRERNAGLEGMPEVEKRSAGGTTSSGKPTMEGRDRFGCQTKNHHPTVKPVKLMQYLIRMVTPQGGVVLDPFMGSGSTGVAAKSLGFEFIGCELSEEYLEIAKRRIANSTTERKTQKQMELG